jgi:FAD/FMN-containing dehydrogenase
MLEVTVKSGVARELGKIVGSEFVSTNPADLYIYSQDLTQAEPSWPDIVALPKSVEEIQAIIRLANKEKIPVIPYLAGGNIGGLTIPLKGGISLDLKRMDRIIEVNETDMYAVVEAGATFGKMKGYLEKYHPNLVYTYAFSPSSTGIVTNALLQGLDNLSFRYGAASSWVSGLEVVLPTGELVKIGSCAVSKGWQSVAPLPELTGLFLGWQGTTGIITKMAVSLWPKPKYARQLTFLFMDLEGADKALKVLARTRIPDDLIGTSFALSKVSQLADAHKKASIYPAPPKSPGEPEFIVSAEITGNTENELNAKVEAFEKTAREELKDVKMTGPLAAPSNTQAAFPMQALAVLSGGGGLTWVGTYGPMSHWLEAVKKGCALQDKYDITRSCYTRIMNEGHFAGLRWMLPYNKEDPETVRRVEALCLEQLDMVLDMGYIPYKTPVWAVRKLEERADPEWVRLHRRLKEMLDPNNILNPGRWGAPPE